MTTTDVNATKLVTLLIPRLEACNSNHCTKQPQMYLYTKHSMSVLVYINYIKTRSTTAVDPWHLKLKE